MGTGDTNMTAIFVIARRAMAALTLCVILGGQALAQSSDLKIDVPVVLNKAQVMFNMDRRAFEGDTPTGLMYINRLVSEFVTPGQGSTVIAIFHGEAGYMLLDDTRYNLVRGSKRGNPYRALITDLQGKGVIFEQCAQTSRANGWGNADFIPGVRVNQGAIVRIIQLSEQGFTQIHP